MVESALWHGQIINSFNAMSPLVFVAWIWVFGIFHWKMSGETPPKKASPSQKLAGFYWGIDWLISTPPVPVSLKAGDVCISWGFPGGITAIETSTCFGEARNFLFLSPSMVWSHSRKEWIQRVPGEMKLDFFCSHWFWCVGFFGCVCRSVKSSQWFWTLDTICEMRNEQWTKTPGC